MAASFDSVEIGDLICHTSKTSADPVSVINFNLISSPVPEKKYLDGMTD